MQDQPHRITDIPDASAVPADGVPRAANTCVVAYVHGEDVAAGFHRSMLDLWVWDVTHDVRILNQGGHIAIGSGTQITGARNQAVEFFLDRTEADIFVGIDTDMIFPPYAVDRLAAKIHPERSPIVGGLCFGIWRGEEASIFPTIYWWTGDHNVMARATEYPPDTMLQVGATGMGFIAIHRNVLETMRARADDIGAEAPWHWFAEQIFQGRPMSEDITFCQRATRLGFPIYVDTGLKIGHRKTHILTEETFVDYQATLREPEFVIAGTGRSGTGYIAAVLNAAGIRTGHEQWFNPHQLKSPKLVGEASWIATNHLDDYDGVVFHQIRHPLKVIRSLINGELLEEWARPYLDAKLEPIGGSSGDYLDDMVRFVAHNLETAEKHATYTWRLEDVDIDVVRTIAGHIGRDIDEARVAEAIAHTPRDTNQHRAKPAIAWADIPDSDAKSTIERIANQYGYDLSEV